MKKVPMIMGVVWLLAVSLIFYAFQPLPVQVDINKKFNVGLLIMATGKYVNFVPRLIASAQKFFLPTQDVTYFVFTNGDLPAMANLVKVPQDQMGWPYDTMMRFHTYNKNKGLFADYDYLFACDADMEFVGPVGNEILSNLVGTQHPNYIFEPKPYDTNPMSMAVVNKGEGRYYFAGAFYGGTKDEFVKLINTAQININIDLARGIIARVNDESHLNRYFIDHEPTKVLNPSYCHFESWHSPYPRKLIAFDRADHGKDAKRVVRQFNPLAYYQKILKEELST